MVPLFRPLVSNETLAARRAFAAACQAGRHLVDVNYGAVRFLTVCEVDVAVGERAVRARAGEAFEGPIVAHGCRQPAPIRRPPSGLIFAANATRCTTLGTRQRNGRCTNSLRVLMNFRGEAVKVLWHYYRQAPAGD